MDLLQEQASNAQCFDGGFPRVPGGHFYFNSSYFIFNGPTPPSFSDFRTCPWTCPVYPNLLLSGGYLLNIPFPRCSFRTGFLDVFDSPFRFLCHKRHDPLNPYALGTARWWVFCQGFRALGWLWSKLEVSACPFRRLPTGSKIHVPWVDLEFPGTGVFRVWHPLGDIKELS